MFEDMNGWLAIGGLAAAGGIAACWRYISLIYQQITSRFVLKVKANGYAAEAVVMFLKDRTKITRFGLRDYIAWMLPLKSARRTVLVPMERMAEGKRIFWLGWKPILVGTDEKEVSEGGKEASGYGIKTVTLTFLRGMFDADELITMAVDHYNERVGSSESPVLKDNRHFIKHIFGTAGKPISLDDGGDAVEPSSGRGDRSKQQCMQHRFVSHKWDDIGQVHGLDGNSLDRLALNREQHAMVQEAVRWKESETWYRERGIPWRRGWLLHGAPGTGKTAIARALAEDLDLPVFVYDLASMFNDELRASWTNMLSNVPCMALIEDVDAVFHGRKNVTSRDQHLTFDCFLNCLDGIERSDGLFLVVTTNQLQHIDAALGAPIDDEARSTRPGRIDRAMRMGPLDEEGRIKIAKRILSGLVDDVSKLVEAGDGESGAQFQERCAQLAMHVYWNDCQAERVQEEPTFMKELAG